MSNLAKKYLSENDEHKKLYVDGIILNDPKTLKILEQDFNDYLFKACLCAYIKKSIGFSSLRIKKKKNKIVNREKLYLNVIDVNFQEERLNLVPDKEIDIIDKIFESQKNFDYTQVFSNKRLSNAFIRLTSKEKEIIKECVVNDRSQANVAKDLGISRQAVNKIKNSALKKLNRELKGA
ncbi:sigma factor-like helix-turn-helix DNA-binding protein [Wukongibacter baidiensis]|uniref:sigma factor-like helix-turn-helix DNA-binding protein n=1 Tax=Wukongibacter baidiensis TaxID=1723361 RepID=UPI003D7FB715